MPQQLWMPVFDSKDLDDRLENAFRRVAGSIGFALDRDRCNTMTLKNTAADAMDAGLEGGPLFMRLGRGLMELGSYSPGAHLSLQDIAGEILREFYAEGTAAYQAAKSALYAGALRHTRNCGLSEEESRPILDSAEAAFSPPSKDAFTQQAMLLVRQPLSLVSQAFLGAGAGFILCIMLVRLPHLAAIGAAIAGGITYYICRNRLRARSEGLLRQLPRQLYDLLHTGLNTNTRRYADTVNAALKTLTQ